MDMEDDYLLTEELVVVQVLDGISSEKIRLDDAFFSDSYRSWVQSKKLPSINRKLQIVKEIEDDYLDEEESIEENQTLYDETNEEMLLDLELYNDIYQMPMFMMTNKEWDLFFKEMYSYYLEKGLLEEYLPDMVTLNRMAIAKSLIENQEVMTLTTYISALKYMESEVIEISNILEIIERLEGAFQMQNLKALIQNANGSYGNYGKEFQIPLENVGGMEAYFPQEGVKEITLQDDCPKIPQEELDNKVVSFQKYLEKRRK